MMSGRKAKECTQARTLMSHEIEGTDGATPETTRVCMHVSVMRWAPVDAARHLMHCHLRAPTATRRPRHHQTNACFIRGVHSIWPAMYVQACSLLETPREEKVSIKETTLQARPYIKLLPPKPPTIDTRADGGEHHTKLGIARSSNPSASRTSTTRRNGTWSAALFNHTHITKLGRKSRLDCPLLVQHSCAVSHHAHHKEHSQQNNALPGHSNVLSQPPPTPTPRQRQPKPKPPPFRILSSIVLDSVLANKTNANRSKPAVRAALKGGTDLCRSYIVIGYNFSGASRTRGRVMKRSRGLHSRSPPWRKRCRRPSG